MKRLRNWLLLSALALPGAAPAHDQTAGALSQSPSAAAAPIALLADLSSGQILFAREANQRFLPASMTKAMTALVAFDLIASGKLKETDRFTVRPDTASRWTGKGTTLNLRAGETITVHDLLMGTTTVSANDAAVVLAEGAAGSLSQWTATMNARAEALGMTGSHFASANGFPDGGKTYVTANDLVRLARALIQDHPQLYRRYFGQQAMQWHGARLRSHDPLSGVLPGADGIKTGHSLRRVSIFLGQSNGKAGAWCWLSPAPRPNRAGLLLHAGWRNGASKRGTAPRSLTPTLWRAKRECRAATLGVSGLACRRAIAFPCPMAQLRWSAARSLTMVRFARRSPRGSRSRV